MFGLGYLSLAMLYRVISCFNSPLTIFPHVSLLKPEDLFNPLFKAIPCSVSWVRKPIKWTVLVKWYSAHK